MKKFKRFMAFGLAATMCVSMLAGCGSTAKEEAADTAAETEAAESGAEAGEIEVAGGTTDVVTIGLDSDWNDISPFGTMSSTRSAIMNNFYEYAAIRFDFGASLEDMVLECAKGITQVDDVTYDVEFYDNITDSEGNAITAEDYAWSAMAMKDAGNYEKLNSYLESVTAVDTYTAEIKLSSNPLGTIEYILAIVPVISQAAYEASSDGMTTKPVTTGVYSVEEMVPGSTLTLVKNENYWAKEDPSQVAVANADKVVYKVITEAAQMATALQTGDIDAAQYMDTTAITSFYNNGTATEGYTVNQLNSNMMFTLLPNMSENSVVSQSKELREAIYYAINADDCMTASTGGYGSSLHAMANPLSGDYDSAWDERDYYSYNVDTAKAKLEESGVDLSGTTLKILTLAGAFNLDKVATVIQNELQQIGINSEIVSVEDALYQTYKLDPTQWDLMLDIKGTDDYCTFPWSLLFDNRSFDDVTANFIADDDLQAKLEICLATDTHNQESVDAFEQALEDNAYCYGLFTRSQYIVGNANKIATYTFLQGNYVLPGLCTYVQ